MAETAIVDQPAEPGTLGFLIHTSRTNQGIRDVDLARNAKVDLFHLRYIERGESIPSHAVRRQIASALGLNDVELAKTPTTVRPDGRLVRIDPVNELTPKSLADLIPGAVHPKPAAHVVVTALTPAARSIVRYHAIEGLTGLDLTARVNHDLQLIQQHENASAGPHTPRTRGSVTSVTTVPTGQLDGVSVVIVYVADTDLFSGQRH